MSKHSKQTDNTKPFLRRRKGWIGFVWGYKDWVRACEEEGRWDNIEWNSDHSGAKEVHVDDIGKITYKY